MKFSTNKLLEILEDYNPRAIGTDIRANCPECNHKEFYISVEKNNNPFQCWRKNHCGWSGNIYTLLYKLNKNYLLKDNVPNVYEDKITLPEEFKTLTIDTPTIRKPLGFAPILTHKHLENRNIFVNEKYPIGISKIDLNLRDRIIFLVYENQELKGYVARDITETKDNKYYNTPNVDFGKLLYGIDDIQFDTKTVILVEGIIDKINVDTILGLNDIPDIKCLSTFGSKISIEQITKLHRKCPNCNVILMYDPDAIGQMQQYSFDVALKFHTQIAKITCANDPGAMTHTELITSLSNLWSPYEYFVGHVSLKINESKSNSRNTT